MKRILVIYYSQSGDVGKVVETFVEPLRRPGVEVVCHRIAPARDYPYPWGTVPRLFSVFPECFLGPDDPVQPLPLRPGECFDLVILGFQVWHLAPSLPIQAFFRSESAAVLRDTPVVTLCVSRNMWQSASERMKELLDAAGARHIDNVVVTHQGPPWATFVSVPRALLYGKRDRLWGIFPPADLSQSDLDRVAQLGAAAAERLLEHDGPPREPLLAGQPTVDVQRRYIMPELGGWYAYRWGERGRPRRPTGTLGAKHRNVPLHCLALGLDHRRHPAEHSRLAVAVSLRSPPHRSLCGPARAALGRSGPMKALVTGGNGFTGSHLIDRLLAEGIGVRCLVRPTSNRAWLQGKAVEFIECDDLGNAERVKQAVRGVDLVFHVLGTLVARDLDEYRRVNVAPVGQLLAACAGSPSLKRFVLIGSQGAAGPNPPGVERLGEDDPCRPVSAYGESKREAEELTRQYQGIVPFTIVRPSVMYGPRDKTLLTLFQTAKRKGWIPQVGRQPKTISLRTPRTWSTASIARP